MDLPIQPPYPPIEAKSVEKIPTGDEWIYEPKWDGFRCLAFRDGDEIALQIPPAAGLEPFNRRIPRCQLAGKERPADAREAEAIGSCGEEQPR